MKTFLLAGIASFAAAAFAQDAPIQLADASAAVEAADAGDIVVTGVRGGAPRTVADSPVPIDVISPRELKATGRVGLKEVLGNIVPSLTMPALGGGGTSASVRPIAIRGLSGDYLLVLVNGKRRHTTSLINNLSRIAGGSTPVDIDLIPTVSVGRIEVLRDGAAAQYGSDAISGVINLILDNSADGGEFNLQAGQLYERGAELLQGSLSVGTPLGGDGFIRLSLEARYRDRARSSAEPVPFIFLPVNGAPDPRETSVDHLIAGGYGRSNRDKIALATVNAEAPISEELSLYTFNTLAYRDIEDKRGAAFPALTGFGDQPNTQGFTSLPQIYPAGFQAFRKIREWDFQVAAGLKGKLGEWGFDLSSSYGQDNVRLDAFGTLNPSLGRASPSGFFMGKQIQDLWVNNLDVTRAFEIGLAEPVQLSVGLEYRWEKFRSLPGEPDSYRDGGYVIPRDGTPFGIAYSGRSPSPGLVSFTGTSPADAASLSRNNYATYADLSATILPGWFVGLAGRFEHYDDSAGDTVSGKVSTRLELGGGFALRGGVNTGFRAPSLAQTGFSTTQNTVTLIGFERVSTTSKFLPVNSTAAIALGAQSLEPEKSLNLTGGATFDRDGFRVTVDLYQIDVDDRIVKTEFLGTAANGGAAVRALLVANGINNVDSAQFFVNAIDTRTRGVDAVAEYELRTSTLGQFRLSAAYSYNRTKIRRVIDNPAQLAPLNLTLFGRQARQDLEVAVPRTKLVLTTDWTLGRLHTLARAARYGRYTEASNVAAGDRSFGAKWVTDLEVGYDVTDAVTLAVGANNLFDVYPDRNGVIASDGSGAYGSFAPFGLSGGFYYVRAATKW